MIDAVDSRCESSQYHLIMNVMITLQTLHRHTKLASPLLPETSLDSSRSISCYIDIFDKT